MRTRLAGEPGRMPKTKPSPTSEAGMREGLRRRTSLGNPMWRANRGRRAKSRILQTLRFPKARKISRALRMILQTTLRILRMTLRDPQAPRMTLRIPQALQAILRALRPLPPCRRTTPPTGRPTGAPPCAARPSTPRPTPPSPRPTSSGAAWSWAASPAGTPPASGWRWPTGAGATSPAPPTCRSTTGRAPAWR